jgi:UDP-GlcNAc:undecaprenyl-phosphate/decaprenyl-phosphate GlcNAc-1-phosphate transferase
MPSAATVAPLAEPKVIQALSLSVGFAASLLFSAVLVPWIRAAAIKAKLYDVPGGRKLHAEPVPRLGGVAIFMGFIGALGLVGMLGENPLTANGILGLLAGGTLMFLLGLLDDFLDLPATFKLFGQVFSACVAFGLGVSVTSLDLPGSLLLLLHAFSFPVTLLWLVGVSNAVNFIDGLDGLAAGVSACAALTLALLALFTHQPEAALLATLLAGACLGFLVHNTHPARIFMGDSGALFIGFTLASIAVLGVLKTYTVVTLTPVLALAVPVADITYSTLRRLLRGQNPMLADSDHLHHRLLKAGMPQQRVVFTFYGVCLAAGALVAGYLQRLPQYLCLMGFVVVLMVLLVTFVRQYERRRAAAQQQT